MLQLILVGAIALAVLVAFAVLVLALVQLVLNGGEGRPNPPP